MFVYRICVPQAQVAQISLHCPLNVLGIVSGGETVVQSTFSLSIENTTKDADMMVGLVCRREEDSADTKVCSNAHDGELSITCCVHCSAAP